MPALGSRGHGPPTDAALWDNVQMVIDAMRRDISSQRTALNSHVEETDSWRNAFNGTVTSLWEELNRLRCDSTTGLEIMDLRRKVEDLQASVAGGVNTPGRDHSVPPTELDSLVLDITQQRQMLSKSIEDSETKVFSIGDELASLREDFMAQVASSKAAITKALNEDLAELRRRMAELQAAGRSEGQGEIASSLEALRADGLAQRQLLKSHMEEARVLTQTVHGQVARVKEEVLAVRLDLEGLKSSSSLKHELMDLHRKVEDLWAAKAVATAPAAAPGPVAAATAPVAAAPAITPACQWRRRSLAFEKLQEEIKHLREAQFEEVEVAGPAG